MLVESVFSESTAIMLTMTLHTGAAVVVVPSVAEVGTFVTSPVQGAAFDHE